MGFKFIIEKNIPEEEDLILIKEEVLTDIKCGICGDKLIARVYTINGKLKRKICCDKCKAETWK